MVASLIGVSGPHERRSFPIGAELTIGRDPGNTIALDDPSISRRHCAISSNGSGIVLRDLDSYNGTIVNGVAIAEHRLEHGDHIKVGTSVFRFNVHDQAVPRPAIVSLEELTEGETETLQSDTLSAEAQAVSNLSQSRLVRDFGVLLMIATRLRGIRNSESLLWQLVGVLLEVIPAQRVAILLGEDASSLEPAFAWDKESGPGIPVRVSRKTVLRAAEEQKALLVNNVPANWNTTSLNEMDVYSVLCAPMLTPDKLLGVLYMDTRHRLVFDAGHLQMISAVATISAIALENTRSIERLDFENQQLKAEIKSRFDMIGEGPSMQELYRFISKVAPSDSSVLIHGESGTGKELVARAIHRNSPRAEAPFMAINCAALSETLLESELFGHEKGAFTGAVAQKRGYLEAADGGTVFLDEIGELALPLQAKLLRVLQEREVVRVGGTRPIKVNIRVIAATNRVLADMVKEKEFREDLFYRLNVVSHTLPPLRKRREDIPMLARHFVEKFAPKSGRKLQGISEAAIACLQNYDWPGNVRELENAIERAVVLGSTSQVLPDDLPEVLLESNSADSETLGYHTEVARKKKELILKALEEAEGNFTNAAKLLGVHPNYLHRLVRVLDLRPALSRTAKK